MNNINSTFQKASQLTLTCLLMASTSLHASSDPFSKEIVKLYSDGKVVGKWEASEKGRMVGQCYVFKIKKGIHTPQVRVCGTFSVEAKKYKRPRCVQGVYLRSGI